jgi:hypothetical protein
MVAAVTLPALKPPHTTVHVGACNMCGGDMQVQTKQPVPAHAFGKVCSVCGKGCLTFNRYQLAPKVARNGRKPKGKR